MGLGSVLTAEGHICKFYLPMTSQLPILTRSEPTKEVLIIDIRHRPYLGTLSAPRDIVTVPLPYTSQTSTFLGHLVRQPTCC
eukprot:10028223-Lingulodinium_polyedra.AAC.1